uniref:DAZ interacting zinc finger protein 1 like n=1 Tax=Sus scrofa TaxID=9823 RepID=A0A8D1JCR4_PIG
MQSLTPTSEGLNGPLLAAYSRPAFKFQPRRESVDWRRISALDVDRVAWELDVATLQENIASVTFCNLDGEVCSRCRQPVDPALLKVVRLAQLSIEYLLHCQDCLSTSVVQLEARLQASLGQQEHGRQELGRQADELKGVREESRRRRKMINTLQQLLLQTGAQSYHTCHLCDKTFMNATFLQGHMQRRHAGMVECGKQKNQEQPIEEVLEELRAKLKWTQGELEAQREAERQRQVQEAEIMRQREMEIKKEFDEWKEKEQAKLYEEIDKFKKLLWDEFKSISNQNSALEEKLQALQSYGVMKSNLGSLQDEEPKEQLIQAQELQALKEKRTEWKRKMKALKEKHIAQKKEVQALWALDTQRSLLCHQLQEQDKRLQERDQRLQERNQTLQEQKHTLLEQNEMLQEQNERLEKQNQRLWEQNNKRLQKQRKAAAQTQHQITALHAQLQEQARRIAANEEMIQTMSLKKLEAGDGFQSPGATNHSSEIRKDPKTEDTEEDSSEKELEDHLRAQWQMLAVLKHNRVLLNQFRSVLEEVLEERLQSMGIKRDAKGISAQTFGHLEPLVRTGREQKARKFPEFLSLRKKFIKVVTRKVKERQRSGSAVSQPDGKASVKNPRNPLVIKEAHPKARIQHVALPSKPAEPPMTTLQRGGNPRPTPAPRSRAPRPSGTPACPGPGLSTPPFSSEEDPEKDAVSRASLQPTQAPLRTGPWLEDDWDWCDTETSKGSAQLSGKGSGGLSSESGTLVQSIVKNLEKQLDAPAKKPAGGVSLFLTPKAGPQQTAVSGRKPQLSEDESDLEISSLDDLLQDLSPKDRPKLLHPKLPEKFGASSWTPSQPRVSAW